MCLWSLPKPEMIEAICQVCDINLHEVMYELTLQMSI